jgi:hypothetical protein
LVPEERSQRKCFFGRLKLILYIDIRKPESEKFGSYSVNFDHFGLLISGEAFEIANSRQFLTGLQALFFIRNC